jgi:hypothetical protein
LTSGAESPPAIPAEARAFRVVELVRIGLGLACCHRALDIAGYAVLDDRPSAAAAGSLVDAGVAALVAAGVLTPLSLAALLVRLGVHPVADYLGLQVARMLCWGLLLAGAGRRLGLDALALRHPAVAHLVRPLYLLGPEGAGGLASVRLLLLALYWTVALSGVRAHFFDPFWRKGEVLQLALTMPYMSDHYGFFQEAARRYPAGFDLACRAGLYVQALWQTALLPLFLLPFRAVRAFVILQGLLFFLVSLFFLNLGYLAVFELLLWALLFGTAPRWGFGARAGTILRPEHGARRAVFLAGSLAAAVFLASNVARTVDDVAGTRLGRSWSFPLWHPFGLEVVDVFNETDIRMGAAHLVLVETDAEGRPLRVVPFLDREGGRLDYLRNDRLYFQSSLRWQRRQRGVQFTDRDPARLTLMTRQLLQEVMALDVCLTGARAPRFYAAVPVTRDIDRSGGFPVWTPAVAGPGTRLVVTAAKAGRIAGRRDGSPLGCFVLPPGHSRSAEREAATLTWAHDVLGAALTAREPPG